MIIFSRSLLKILMLTFDAEMINQSHRVEVQVQ